MFFDEGTISTCPAFEKTEDCTMSKPLYIGQGSLKKSEAQETRQSEVFSKGDNMYVHSHVRMYKKKI